jgi:hypothetical protein
MKMSCTEDGSLNRNVAYALGVLAKKAPSKIFENHTGSAVQMLQLMWNNSDEDDAKDNCMCGLLKILQKYP